MKDRKSLKWIYYNCKKQIPSIALLCLCKIVMAIIATGLALLFKKVIDSAVRHNVEGIFIFASIVLIVLMARLLLNIGSQSLEVSICAKNEMSIKTKLFNNILNKDYKEINKYHSGELMNRLTSDIYIISDGVTSILPDAMYMVTQFTGAFAVLVVFDWRFAIIFIIAGILVLITASVFRTKLKQMHKEVQSTDGKVRSFLQEIIESLLVVKTFGIEERISEHGSGLQKVNYEAKMHRRRVSIFANSGFGFIFNVGYLYALVWCSYKLYVGSISYGTLIAVLQLISQVQSPFANITKLLPQFYSVVASAERVMEIEAMPEEKQINESLIDANDIYDKLDKIEFKNINFSYDRDMVLENAEIDINKGDFVAIKGISGIGKSTLLKMLLGVLTPASGSIDLVLKDGTIIPVDKMTRPLFSYVPQGNFLLSGTIIENLKLVNENATEDEIKKALNISSATTFVNELPMGLDTVIGEKGMGLSEGQVQRLAIARAILSKAPVILLDEATSALDSDTEQQVLQHLQNLQNRTCIIVTHKKAALSVCNKIVTIKHKKIYCEDK